MQNTKKSNTMFLIKNEDLHSKILLKMHAARNINMQ